MSSRSASEGPGAGSASTMLKRRRHFHSLTWPPLGHSDSKRSASGVRNLRVSSADGPVCKNCRFFVAALLRMTTRRAIPPSSSLNSYGGSCVCHSRHHGDLAPSTVPGGQFLLRERVEEPVVEHYAALPGAELRPALAMETYETRHGPAIACNHDSSPVNEPMPRRGAYD